MKDFWKFAPYVGAGVAVAGLGLYVIRRRTQGQAPEAPALPPKPVRVCGKDYPRDTVIVHSVLRGPYAPSLGNMVVKLETYLRMAKIPYQLHADNLNMIHGPKRKIPWIEYNGQEMGDSELIIDFLKTELNADLDAHLSPIQKAQARALQKWVDEFTYWAIVYTRWCILLDDWYQHVEHLSMPGSNIETNRAAMKQIGDVVGIARHSDEEVGRFLEDDLEALSVLLGDQDYFFGDKPTKADCAVFGQLTQLRWHTPDSCAGKRLLREKYTNLNNFCLRIKDKFWPDWDECCKNP